MKKNKILLLNIITVLVFSLFAQSCVKGTKAERFVNSINQQNNNQAVSLVKDPTSRSGYIIVKEGNDFYAIKYSRYTSNSWGIANRRSENSYYQDYKFKVTSIGDGYYRGPLGYKYEETNPSSKDLEVMGALSENIHIVKMAKNLEGQFGLSEQRSLEVAEITTHWNKLSKSRSMTQKDKNLFSKRLLGVDFNRVEKALSDISSENLEDFDTVLDKAAEVNGIGQEHMRDLIENYLLK